jgi:carboxylesterase
MILHGGGGGTAADFRYIGDIINRKKRYDIRIPLLPGFGTNPEKLKETQIPQWKKHIEREFDLLKSNTEHQFIGGHSMGGILALIKAKESEVDGIFTISAPVGIKGLGNLDIPIPEIKRKYIPVDAEMLKIKSNNKWVGYDKIPVNLLTKFKELIAEMKLGLSQIRAPIILFQGKKDKIIQKDSMDFIYENVGSKIKEKVWLENNEHDILESPDQEALIENLINFIEKVV